MLLFYCKDTVQYVKKMLALYVFRVSNAKEVVVSLQSNHRSEQQFTREKQKQTYEELHFFFLFFFRMVHFNCSSVYENIL